jgi:hypothetical protein
MWMAKHTILSSPIVAIIEMMIAQGDSSQQSEIRYHDPLILKTRLIANTESLTI